MVKTGAMPEDVAERAASMYEKKATAREASPEGLGERKVEATKKAATEAELSVAEQEKKHVQASRPQEAATETTKAELQEAYHSAQISIVEYPLHLLYRMPQRHTIHLWIK
jgi:hypothetical protein